MATPRRLVYCLPQRTLVEQTASQASEWCRNLGLDDEVDIVTLMGGQPRTQWYLRPEKFTLLVGTQDMLLSRALNRGYGSSPYMWPMEFGLLNNDCLWIMDEVQLMANGLPTSTQLAGLRRELATFGPSHSMWMSATCKREWLCTVDHPEPAASECLALGSRDLMDPGLCKRLNARKIVTEAKPDGKKATKLDRRIAELAVARHESGSLTLVMVNTVGRAQSVYKTLRKSQWAKKGVDLLMVHSRLRGKEREDRNRQLLENIDTETPGRVVVATQVVEAGVDISAHTLITELAPWSSMVQRMGRCNRAGEFADGQVLWIDPGNRSQDTAPYEPSELETAREHMLQLELAEQSASPSNLDQFELPYSGNLTVLRRRDLIGLFDTTPDLSGQYMDVSQYVRNADTKEVTVYWRQVSTATAEPEATERRPHGTEAVSVPMGGRNRSVKGIRDYLDKGQRKAWSWDHLTGQWRRVGSQDLFPGMTLRLDAQHGGYSVETGWDPDLRDPVPVVEIERLDPEADRPLDDHEADPGSISRQPVSLEKHTQHVLTELEAIIKAISNWLDESGAVIQDAQRLAARYHDIGKAHPDFQKQIRKGIGERDCRRYQNELLAKSDAKWFDNRQADGQDNQQAEDPASKRPYFRHELGSALAILQHARHCSDDVRELAAYLAASHHGKVRLTIRSLPGRRRRGEWRDGHPDPEYLLGYCIKEPETLPKVDLGPIVRVNETELDMSIAQMGTNRIGRSSWMAMSLALLEFWGPLRLAYLEALLRAADQRASQQEKEPPLSDPE